MNGYYVVPFAWIVLLPLGVALHWTLRMIYGHGRRRRDDQLLLVLTMAAWLLVFAGILGPLLNMSGILSILLIAIFFLVAIIVVGTYRDAQRRSLLWALAAAAERELPLPEAARAFAADRMDEMGRRADRLADLLEAGVALPEAMRQSKNQLPIDAELAARLGQKTGNFTGVLHDTVREGSRYDPVWDSIWQRLAYFLVLVLFAQCLMSFVMLKIVPTYNVLFEDFSVELPPITRLVIDTSQAFVAYWFLFAPLYLVPLLFIAYGIVYVCGWLRWEPPGVSWLTRRYHGSMVLRFLAQAVDTAQPLDQTFELLARSYPREHVRTRLHRVVAQVAEGHDWCDALRASGLIGAAEAGVLQSAQRAGNLAWALREMADSAVRRTSYRASMVLNLGIPTLLIAIGVGVGIYAVALFYPLTHLIFTMT